MKNLSNFQDINKIYFIGIGGISLSALASLMKGYGFDVYGSDITKSEITDKLQKNKIKVFFKQHKKNILKIKPDLVVYSGAIKFNNPELVETRLLNIKCLERADFIKEILHYYKNVISIAGSHGKTTTTSMISEIFDLAGLKPNIHIGGESVNLNSNFKMGDNKFFITEACEYKHSFLKFKSTAGVILNIEEDHPDCYKNLEEIKSAFNEFSNICNHIIINSNYSVSNKNITTFNFNKAQFKTKNVRRLSNGGYSFCVLKNDELYDKYVINIFGKHNILNALASICVADLYNIDKEIIKKALFNFKGIKRRFEKVDTNKISGDVYFDYAHHPTEIKKLIEEVKSQNRPIICVFQPHTYTRTKKYFNEFLGAFNGAYQTIFYKTYSAREKEIKGAKSKDIYNVLKTRQNCFYYNNFNKILKHLKKYSKSNTITLFVGAGDIYNIKSLL